MPFIDPAAAAEVPSELRDSCTRFLPGHGPVVPGAASALSSLRRRLPLMPEAFVAAATGLAREQGIWTISRGGHGRPGRGTAGAGRRGRHGELTPDQIAGIVATLTT
jgi:hypothetical protein